MTLPHSRAKKRVVVVGGGTGTHTVLRGLKHFSEHIEIAAIVSMADSGGSTGRLRDEFGQLPVGDIRNALTALADSGSERAELLRSLFLYRFEKGAGLSGHNFGNLFLTALTDIFGNEEAAISAAGKILRIAGTVVPVTTDNVQLVAQYDDGVRIVGEAGIDVPDTGRYERKVTEVLLTPEAHLNQRAHDLISNVDLIVVGPGDLYTSIIPNALVTGFTAALEQCRGRFIYVANLMTRPGQTSHMTVKDHIAEIVRYFKRHPDFVLINNTAISDVLLEQYAKEHEFPVLNDCDRTMSCFKICCLIKEYRKEDTSESGKDQTLVRHDSDLLAAALISL